MGKSILFLLLFISVARANEPSCQVIFSDTVVSMASFRQKKVEQEKAKEANRQENIGRAWGMSREEQKMYEDLLLARDFLFGDKTKDVFIINIENYFYDRGNSTNGKIPIELTVSHNINEVAHPAEIGIFIEITSAKKDIDKMLMSRFYQLTNLLETQFAISNLSADTNQAFQIRSSKADFRFHNEGNSRVMEIDITVNKNANQTYTTSYSFIKDANGSIIAITVKQTTFSLTDGVERLTSTDQVTLFTKQ